MLVYSHRGLVREDLEGAGEGAELVAAHGGALVPVVGAVLALLGEVLEVGLRAAQVRAYDDRA